MSIKSTNSGYIFDDEILDKKLFLIDSDGTKHPSINTNDAIKLANEKKMSVVIVAPAKENSLAIAKVINKGKFLFDIKKKEKEKKKLMINVKEKEITIKPKIGENDLIRFINNTIDWLKSGYHVKLKIDAKDDISKLSSSEIKKLPRNLDKDEFKKRKNIIFKNNEAQIDILVKNIYDKFVTKLGNIARILQPLKKLTPVLYSAFFSFDKK